MKNNIQESILTDNKMNWQVEKIPALHYHPTKKHQEIKGHYFIRRKDNLKILGAVKSSYVPTQNKDTFNYILEIVKDYPNVNLQDVIIKSFNEGRKVCFMFRIEDIKIGKVISENYIYAISSHDGSSRLAFGLCNKVIGCANMFPMLLSDITATKFKHTSNVPKKIKDIDLKTHIQQYVLGCSALYKKMFYTPVNVNIINETICRMLGIDKWIAKNIHKFDEKYLHSPENRTGHFIKIKDNDYILSSFAISNIRFTSDLNNISSHRDITIDIRLAKKVKELNKHIADENFIHGTNYYGLFNGLTRYANRNMEIDRENGKLESVMLGKGSKFMKKGFELIINKIK